MNKLICLIFGHGYIYPPKMGDYRYPSKWQCSRCKKLFNENSKTGGEDA